MHRMICLLRILIFLFCTFIVDDFDSENGIWICRSVYDAPEIDGEVYIDGGYDVEVGDIVKVHVVQSDIYDLYAELV